MNVLDQIYGRPTAEAEKVAGVTDLTRVSAYDYIASLDKEDIEKVASIDGIDQVDLHAISAHEFLEAIGAFEEPEKVATDLEGIDLTKVPAADLAAYLAQVEQEKTASYEERLVQSMIENGEFARADMAGRITARAHVDELQKLASAGADDLPDYISLDGLSGEDLQELLASGEYELEKEASFRGGLGYALGGAENAAKRLMGRGGKAAEKATEKAAEGGGAASRMDRIRAMAEKSKGAVARPWQEARVQSALGRMGGESKASRAKGAAEAFLSSRSGKVQAGLGAAGVGAATGGGFALRRKKKQS
jgi:hypothetical protein